jgi:hypothetical protein
MINTDTALFCSLCKRKVPKAYFEYHHSTPRCKKGKEKIGVCCDCGDQIHALFTTKELKNRYSTTEALLNDERIQKWILWIQKKPNNFGFCMKKLKRKR